MKAVPITLMLATSAVMVFSFLSSPHRRSLLQDPSEYVRPAADDDICVQYPTLPCHGRVSRDTHLWLCAPSSDLLHPDGSHVATLLRCRRRMCVRSPRLANQVGSQR